MRGKLKRLSAKDILRALGVFGFEIVSTRGSHAKVRRIRLDGTRDVLTVPLHKEISPGTVRAIYRQALRFVPEDNLRSYFFSE